MNLLTKLFTLSWQQGWELVGWTMCYFLAGGAAVALVGALARLLLRGTRPQICYSVSLGTLLVLAALPVAIAMWLVKDLPVETPAARPIAMRDMSEPLPPAPVVIDLKYQALPEQRTRELVNPPGSLNMLPVEAPLEVHQPAEAGRAGELEQRDFSLWLESVIRYLPWVWLVGAPLTFLLLTTGLIGSERLRQQSSLLVEGPVFAACERLRGSLRLSRRVGVAVCERITSPLLVGVVRPLILLPPAALTGWSPDQLEMVLLHELAHVRRWDNLMNLLQRLVESVLFFHPCVWWVSRWARREREECCDAVVVARTAKPQAYAELLVALATPRSALTGLAMARHPLAGRVRKILKLEDEKMLVSRGTFGWLGLVGVSLLAVALWQPTVAEEPSAPVAQQKEITTESTESAEARTKELEIVLNSRTPLSEIEAVTKRHAANSKAFHVVKNEDGTVTLVTGLVGYPSSAVTAKQLTVYKNGEMKIDGLVENGLPRPTHFLSLEEQLAADLAYKLLNVELERLNEEELKRVKAKQFTGGLLVTDVQFRSSGSLSGGGRSSMTLLKGDLLVGLHVWPTTSLADVQQILLRDDLKELSPLKYYVIRQTKRTVPVKQRDRQGGGFGGGEYGGFGDEFGGEFGISTKIEMVDELVKGRVMVNISELPQQKNRSYNTPGGGARASTQSASSRPRYSAPPSGPQPQEPKIKDTVRRIVRAQKNEAYNQPPRLPANQSPAQNQFSSQAANSPAEALARLTIGDQVKVVVLGTYPDQPISDIYAVESMGTLALGPTYGRVKVAGLTILEAERAVKKQLEKLLTEPAVQITFVTRTTGIAKFSAQTASQPSAILLYDGKTFDQWRTQWKTELKTEKRTEAIRALAAFGRAGHGQDAAEAILDVAGEYDFLLLSQSPKGRLKEKVLDVLCTGSDGRLDTEVWLPLLLKRYENDPKKWNWLTRHALERVGYLNDDYTREQLLQLAKDKDSALHATAVYGLANATQPHTQMDPRILQLAKEFLSSNDAELAQEGLYLITRFAGLGGGGGVFGGGGGYVAPVHSLPALQMALRHPQLAVRQAARSKLPNVAPEVAKKLVIQATKDLEAATTDESRLIAIRTLAALGPHAYFTDSPLDAFLTKKHSATVRQAAAFALQHQSADNHSAHQKVLERTQEAGEYLDKADYAKEAKQVFQNPQSAKNEFKGGGFF